MQVFHIHTVRFIPDSTAKYCIMNHSAASLKQVPYGSRKAVFMEKKKSLIFLFLAASFILVMLSIPLHIASAQAEPQLHEPLVFPNNALSTGQETIWSCITFGHYPSAEVVRSSWDSVDSYAVRDGDVIRDGELYTRLNEAEWSSDRIPDFRNKLYFSFPNNSPMMIQ